MGSIKIITRLVPVLLLAALATGWGCKKSGSTIKSGYDDSLHQQPIVTVDTNRKVVDVSKYAQARVFPGLVCNSEPRIDTTVTMDLNYNYVGGRMRISVEPQPQFSTGFYAAPGELVIIDMPVTEYAVAVQIGAWTDNLSNLSNRLRDPVIITKMQLAPGRNYVRNLYGGPIYLNPLRPLTQPATISFKNVVKSPDFVLGKTTNAQWQAAVRNSCVPYIELRSVNAVFVVARQFCVDNPIADPTALMTAWNDIVEKDYYGWQGLTKTAADPLNLTPLLAYRFVQDIQPVVGYGHAGFPVVVYNNFDWYDEFTNITRVKQPASWGTQHELGHNNQQGQYWSWSTMVEVTCNLFIFKTADRRLREGSTSAWPPGGNSLPIASALAYAKENNPEKNFDGTDARIVDVFAKLVPFLQIYLRAKPHASIAGAVDGWDFMPYLYTRVRMAQRISQNDQDKKDFLYEALCEFTHQDWIFFFKAWGIQVSNISQGKIAAKGYAKMITKVWEYNPITKTGGNGVVIADPTKLTAYPKTGWSITSFTSQKSENTGISPINGTAAAIIDGNQTSYWHSQYGPNVPPPHRIVVNMGVSQPVMGFIITQRSAGSRNIKNLTIETSADGTTWTAAGGSPFVLTQSTTTPATPQYVVFSDPITARYVRFSTLTSADVWDGSDFAALAEVTALMPPQ